MDIYETALKYFKNQKQAWKGQYKEPFYDLAILSIKANKRQADKIRELSGKIKELSLQIKD